MLGSLYLFPVPADGVPPPAELVVGALQSEGVLGQPSGEREYAAGGDLLGWISFTGCSPSVALRDPGDGTGYCRLRLLGPYRQPALLARPGLGRPRCPVCRSGVQGWQQLLPGWRAEPLQAWHCPECGFSTAAALLDWRHYGASGRLLVEITHIFPGEAAPIPQLMDLLETATGLGWQYAWGPDSSKPD